MVPAALSKQPIEVLGAFFGKSVIKPPIKGRDAVLLYLVSGAPLKVETSRWLSSGKLVAPKEDNIHHAFVFNTLDAIFYIIF